MSPFLIALFKINLVLALFVVAYYAILRRITFYSINRIFLLLGIGFATFYPLIDLSFMLTQQPPAIAKVPQFTQQLRTMVTNDSAAIWNTSLYTIFFTGLTVMIIRLLRQFISLYRIHRLSQPAFIGALPVRLINAPISPFSFGKHIYINPAAHSEKELMTIIAHEHIHVRQHHTLDVLMAELSLTFHWFNPAAWMLRKAIKENLEFMADHRVVEEGTDKKAYQYSLLRVGLQALSLAIANDFNLVDLKQRIRMMNAQRSSRWMLGRYALLLPLLLMITLVFAVSVREPIKVVLSALPASIRPANNEAETITIEAPSPDATSDATALKLRRPIHTPAREMLTIQLQPGTEGTSRERLTGKPLPESIKAPLYEAPAPDKATPAPTEGSLPVQLIKKVSGIPLPEEVVVVVTGYRKPALPEIRITPYKDTAKGTLQEVIVIGRANRQP